MKEIFILKTDVLPAEIPINFSNKNLFNVLVNSNISPRYTIPYNYQVPKPNSIDNRVISLPHPLAQLRMRNFLLDFKLNITSFCKLSPYSIRSPHKVNSINYNHIETQKKKLQYSYENFFNPADQLKFTISSNDILTEYYNFFSYRRYNSIFDFLSSPIFNRAKTRFTYLMKLDIKDFFNSIYTHSLEWAIVGNKAHIKRENFNSAKDKVFNFAKEIDEVCQLINYKETNGLIVGPEFSRVIAEVLLSRIDRNIFRDLYNQGLEFNKDYLIFRYVDDYYIFFQSPFEKNSNILKTIIYDSLRNYKLSVNEEKFKTEKSQHFLTSNSITILKRLFDEFVINFSKKVNNNTKNKYITNFINEFEHLIFNNPKEKQKLVRYVLKSLNTFITEKLVGFDKKLIFELALYLFNYSPEYFTSRYFSMFFLKYQEFYKNNINNEPENLKLLDEEICHIMTKALKQNSDKFNSIYNILYALKFIDKKIPATLLCNLLEKHKTEYFSICSISTYIINTNLSLNPKYYTVIKKIEKQLKLYLFHYEIRSNSAAQDAHYFYIVNDFMYYPGLKSKVISQSFQDLIKNHFTSLREDLKLQFSLSREDTRKLTSSSYYNWNYSYENFFKNSILKSENIMKSSDRFEY